MEKSLRPEVVVSVRVRNAHYGNDVSLVIQQRGIQCPELVSSDAFLVDVESLIPVPDPEECVLVDPAAEYQLLEHLG